MPDDKTPHAKAIDQLHANKDALLKDLEKVLASHGITNVVIASIGLFLKTGGAPKCPDGQDAVWECMTGASGEVECKWVCK
jgi:hypothetical protein